MELNKNRTVYPIVIIALISGYMGLIILTIFGYRGYTKGNGSLNWPQVSGVISYSEVNERIVENDNGTSKGWEPVLTYEYALNSIKYIGSEIGGPMIQNVHPKHAQKIVERYPIGKKVTVYYDPSNPEDSLLIPGVSGETKILLILAGAALLEVIAMHIVLFLLRRKEKIHNQSLDQNEYKMG